MVDTVGEGDGWGFWGNVYGTPGLRSEVQQSIQCEPRLSSLLNRYQKGQSTKLVFNHITNCTNLEIKNLLEAELGRATVNNIRFGKNSSAFVQFYLASVAQTAQKKFDGRRLRGKTLQVRFWNDPQTIQKLEPNPSPAKILSSDKVNENVSVPVKIQQISKVNPGKRERGVAKNQVKGTMLSRDVSKKEDKHTQMYPAYFSLAAPKSQHMMTINCANKWDEACKLSLIALRNVLLSQGPLDLSGAGYKQVLSQITTQDSILAAWPMGLLRVSSAVVIQDKWLCLPGQQPPQNELTSPFKEPWEPMTPSSIKTQVDITSYLRAALCHFGPMNCEDKRLDLVSAQLMFPLDKIPLLRHMQLNPHIFCIINTSVFLFQDITHRLEARNIIKNSDI